MTIQRPRLARHPLRVFLAAPVRVPYRIRVHVLSHRAARRHITKHAPVVCVRYDVR